MVLLLFVLVGCFSCDNVVAVVVAQECTRAVWILILDHDVKGDFQ